MSKFERSSAISKGLGNALETIADTGSLPAIRGRWYFVDPKKGADTSSGKSIDTALASLAEANDRVLDGDGIAVLSYGGTSAETTSYLKKTLNIAKNGLTIVGVAAPTMFGRARIANKAVTNEASNNMSQAAHSISRETGSFIDEGWEVGMTGTIADSGSNNGTTFTVTKVTALTLTVSETLTVQSKANTRSCVLTSYIADLVTFSGNNLAVYNLNIGNFSDQVGSVGGIKVTGNRIYFCNCHFVGAGHATPGAVETARNVLIDGAQEVLFERCTIGTDTVLKAAANGEIAVDGGAWRIRFKDCEVLCYSATDGKGCLRSVDATSWSGVLLFDRCRFSMWNENGMSSADDGASWFIGTAPTSGCVWLNESAELGWAAWDATADNDRVYVSNGAIHAATGGIAILTA